MRGILLLLFIIIPAVELTLLFWASQYIGLLPTFLIIILTGVIGASLAKREGRETWQKVNDDAAMGRVPGFAILEGFLVLVGGLLLLTPGFISDTTGFLLLVRPIRRKLVVKIRDWLRLKFNNNRGSFFIFRK